MPLKNKTLTLLLLIFVFSATTVSFSSASRPTPQDKGDKADKDKSDKDKKDKKKKDDAADAGNGERARPVLWEEPTDIASRDLFHGLGGAEGAPIPSDKFKFIGRNPGGTSEKIDVTDSKGRAWIVKLGAETKTETAATRIVWAVGYHVDQDYFLKRAYIDGRGGFELADVRLERDDDGYGKIADVAIWSWTKGNPFAGTREMNGLKTLMAVLNNWDLKDVNNRIVRPSKKGGGDRNMHIYYVSDLGGTLGKTGSPYNARGFPGLGNAPGGTKGKPDDYASQPLIKGVENGEVRFNYKGKNHVALYGVKVEHARWMGDLLSRLSDKQLGDAFRAGGFEDSEVASFVSSLRSRISELRNLK